VAVAGHGHGHGDARPGAAGIGDPYYPKDGNGGYDVTHYDLDLRYAPATDRLSGVATITARATQDLSRFDLDFVGLRIDSISVNHKQARWNREGQELVIRPARPLRDQKKFTVRIEYAGVPQTIQDPLIGPSGFIHTDDGAIVAGQPHAAATWFPANDHPRDAASFSLDITVPEGLEAISNGVLAHRHTKHGWTTWSWRAEEPMATYLTTLAIGQFQVQDYRADGLRFWDALDPDLFKEPNGNPDGSTYGEVAAGALEHQPEIIRFLESFAGPYPFEAAGGIVDDYPELFFALETQTRPIYSKLFFYDPVSGDDVVVHELAHQWFGDDLRLDGWQHIWLNEGFATYMEFLWFEHEGLATAQQIFENLASIPADDPFWDVKTGDPGPADLFDYEAVYLRGALTLHALRLEVGDAAFFRILERWATTQSGSTVTTAEFVRLAERVSGRQLDDFFRAWLFTAAKPAGLPEAPGPKASAAAASGGAGPVLARLTAERPRR
jgi:aminopeptidase N